MDMKEVIRMCVDELHGIFKETDIDAERKKIDAKLEEAKYNPGALRPIADCMIALLLVAKSRGYGVEAVLKELEQAAQENTGRKWKKMPDGTYQAS